MNKKNIGSSFDNWLYEEVSATAIKRVLSRQLEAAMKERQFSKAEMACRMRAAAPLSTVCSIPSTMR